MPHWQPKEPEQRHVISRRPLQDSMNQHSLSQESSEDANKIEGSGRGRRRSAKGSKMETAHNVKPEIFNVEPPPSNKSLVLHRRPGYGQLGTKCLVKANHFLAEISEGDLSQYSVKIIPEVNSTKLNKAIMAQLVKLHRDTDLGKMLPVYDGRGALYTAGLMPFTLKKFTIILADGDESIGMAKEREFKVTIKFVAHASMHQLRELLSGKQVDTPLEALKIIDIVLRELAAQRYVSVGRFFYSPNINRPQPLGNGLQSWRGFYQSIKPTQMGLSLNIDMSATAFIEPVPVIEFVAQILGKDVYSRPLSDADRVKVKKALRGIKVEVTHRGNMRRKYRIAGLTSQPTRELIFPVDEEKNMKSVVEYFQEVYGFTIQHPHLPCLQVGNPRKVNYLPMEACKIVDGQRYTKRLNDKQITSLLKFSCQRPQEQEMDILKTMHQNGYNQDPYAKEFGISIDDKLTSVEARVLPAPWLKYNDNGKEKEFLPKVGQWNMMNKKVINGGTVNYWACINFSRSVQESAVRGFCHQLAQMCQGSGMEFNFEPVIPIYSARPDQVKKALKYVCTAAANNRGGKELELLIAILPDNNGSLYGDLKRICETELGLISQCCLTKHVLKISRQYLANLSLKINVKMGGRNNVLLDALSWRIPLVSDIPTIIFGADVTHPESGEDCSPSIAAVVASQDWPEVTKYAGLVCTQPHRQELIQDLYKTWQDPQGGTVSGGMIRELLLSFQKATGQKPLRIIFYRDGVSDGQFYQVLLYELDAIRKACASLETSYQPPVTFIVVQKRHHTRLFASNHNDKTSIDKSGNILPGTVVDTKICHPTEFDFYLCSHAGIQGTSRPAHYHVLWDENNFSADEIQSLTNNLCYTYARCTRSVSLVPPAYYAHLAAYRARFYLEPHVHENASMRATRTVNGPCIRPLPALKEKVKVRFRVVFEDGHILSKSQRSEGLNRSWLLLKPPLDTISDLCSYLAHVFNLYDSCPNGIILSMDGFVLPPFESTCIIKDKDVIRVKMKGGMLYEIVEVGDGANIIEEGEIVEKQPALTSVPLLANEEFENETGGYQSEPEEDEDNQSEDTLHVENSSDRKVVSKKRKASKKLQSSKKKQKCSTDSQDTENDFHIEQERCEFHPGKSIDKKKKVSLKGWKGRGLWCPLQSRIGAKQSLVNMLVKCKTKKTSTPRSAERNNGSFEPLPSTKRSDQLQENGTICIDDVHQMPDEIGKVPSRSARRKKAKRQWLRELAKTEKKELHQVRSPEKDVHKDFMEHQQQNQIPNIQPHQVQSPEKDVHNDSMEQQQQNQVPNVQLHQVLSPEKGMHNNSMEHQQQNQNSEADNEIVPIVIRPGHIRFEPLGKDQAAQQNQVSVETFQWNGIISKKKGQKWGKEKFSSRRNDYKDSNEERSEVMTTERVDPPNNPLDFDKLAPLARLPKEGDVIAYRLLELSSTWTPELSSFRVGKTSRYDPESDRVLLTPVPEYPIIFDKSDEDECAQPPDDSLYGEDGSLEIEFSSLVDTRIVKHGNSDPAKAVTDCVNDDPVSSEVRVSTVVPSNNNTQTLAPTPEKDINVWDEFSEALNTKKEQLIREKGCSESSGKSSWSFRAMRGSALGPTMAILRAKNAI